MNAPPSKYWLLAGIRVTPDHGIIASQAKRAPLGDGITMRFWNNPKFGLRVGMKMPARQPDPILVVKRIDHALARITDLEDNPYSDPMPIEVACRLLREVQR